MATWTNLGTVQRARFYDPNNTANTFTVQYNYKAMAVTPGNVRKYTQTVNGTSVIIGDREYPPTEIRITWDQMDKSDLDVIRQFTILSPIVFVDNNDNGYLGVLVIDNVAQVGGMTKNVWGVSASFLVIAPYQGTTRAINVLAAPAIANPSWVAGYVPNGTTLYYWSTAWTPWGESLVSSVLTYTNSSGGLQAPVITWTQPVSPYFKKARLYWNTTNTPASATMLTEVQAGFTGTFTAYGPYVAYNSINPPTFSTAFTGYWSGGLWTSI